MFSVSRAIDLPHSVDEVWAMCADFGAVQRWSPVVATSYLTSEETEGVGCARHCDLVPRGALDEVVSVWSVGTRMVVEVAPSGPVAGQRVTIDFRSGNGGEVSTTVRMSAEVTLQPEAEERAEAIAKAFGGVLASTLAGLRYHLATGNPVDEHTKLSTHDVRE